MVTKLIAKQIAACSILSLAGLGGCNGSDGTQQSAQEPTRKELEAVWQEVQPIIDEELAKEDARSAARFPCTLFDKEAASALLNADLETPMYAHEFKNLSNLDTGDDFSWEAEACSWNNWGDGASLNIWVSRPDDFSDEQVHCYGISDDDTTQMLLGGMAKWDFLESYGWAKLLVCRDDGLFFIEIQDGPVEEAAAKAAVVNVANRLAESL